MRTPSCICCGMSNWPWPYMLVHHHDHERSECPAYRKSQMDRLNGALPSITSVYHLLQSAEVPHDTIEDICDKQPEWLVNLTTENLAWYVKEKAIVRAATYPGYAIGYNNPQLRKALEAVELLAEKLEPEEEKTYIEDYIQGYLKENT